MSPLVVESPELEIDPALARRLLTNFLRAEIHRHGFTRAAVALSGGVDSAVACYLVAEAVGPENVLAVRMPYRTSSPDSLSDAQLVVEAAGVREITIPITDMVDALLPSVPESERVRRGNVMARARMIVVYDQSAALGGLVIGTSNKTELLLGYGTIHGDMASAINPIGDLYKTQVRQMAAHLQVPAAIRRKTPTADLWPDQTDEKEIGYSYDEVDCLLHALIDLRHTRGEAIEAGWPRAMVDRVRSLIARSQFKRRLPLIAKISDRTVGVDFRYPRDWGT